MKYIKRHLEKKPNKFLTRHLKQCKYNNCKKMFVVDPFTENIDRDLCLEHLIINNKKPINKRLGFRNFIIKVICSIAIIIEIGLFIKCFLI